MNRIVLQSRTTALVTSALRFNNACARSPRAFFTGTAMLSALIYGGGLVVRLPFTSFWSTLHEINQVCAYIFFAGLFWCVYDGLIDAGQIAARRPLDLRINLPILGRMVCLAAMLGLAVAGICNGGRL